MRISDWSSDVCSSDLHRNRARALLASGVPESRGYGPGSHPRPLPAIPVQTSLRAPQDCRHLGQDGNGDLGWSRRTDWEPCRPMDAGELLIREAGRSEEHTSELQSLMRTSYAVFCLK